MAGQTRSFAAWPMAGVLSAVSVSPAVLLGLNWVLWSSGGQYVSVENPFLLFGMFVGAPTGVLAISLVQREPAQLRRAAVLALAIIGSISGWCLSPFMFIFRD